MNVTVREDGDVQRLEERVRAERERIWGYLRSHYLSNRVYQDYDELFEAIKTAWNRLEPERLKSLTHTEWIERAA